MPVERNVIFVRDVPLVNITQTFQIESYKFLRFQILGNKSQLIFVEKNSIILRQRSRDAEAKFKSSASKSRSREKETIAQTVCVPGGEYSEQR